MKNRKENLAKIYINILILFVIWSFVFTMTKTSWASFIYIFLILIAIISIFVILEYRPRVISVRLLLWFPFVILSILENLRLNNFEGTIYFSACLIMLLIARQVDFEDVISNKIFILSGGLAILGMIFQIVLPGIYNTYVATFFKNTNDILYWANGYGYTGFTYQLGVTAIILVYFEGIILYRWKNNENMKNMLVLVAIMFIFLTGKRTMALLAILLPGLIIILCNKFSSKKLYNTLCILLMLGILAYFFVMNSDLFINSKILGRFANTIIDLEKGQDVSSNRSLLYKEAFSMFRNNKLFGIGLGNFKEKSFFATDVHNAYIQVLCEQGIVGEVLFIIPLFVNLMFSIKMNRYNQRGSLKLSLFLQLFFIIYGLTGNVMMNEICYVIYFFSIGIMEKSNKKNRAGVEES